MTQLPTRKGMIHRFGPQNGSISDPSAIEESRRIRQWLLGILRFAVTLEQCDRAAVIAWRQRWTAPELAQPNLDLAISLEQAQSSATVLLQSMTSINWLNSAFTSKRSMTADCVEPLKARSSGNVINRHVPDSQIESICGKGCGEIVTFLTSQTSSGQIADFG
jgi:hypothetical protein